MLPVLIAPDRVFFAGPFRQTEQTSQGLVMGQDLELVQNPANPQIQFHLLIAHACLAGPSAALPFTWGLAVNSW
jgi:hypothetical protein